MVTDGKGILAADESTGTIKKRFDSINVVATEDSRRDYREMLFRTTEAMQNYISGVICLTKRYAKKLQTARRLLNSSPILELFRALRLMQAQKIWPVIQAKW